MSEDLRSKGIKTRSPAQRQARSATPPPTSQRRRNLKAKIKTAEGKVQKNFSKAERDAADRE